MHRGVKWGIASLAAVLLHKLAVGQLLVPEVKKHFGATVSGTAGQLEPMRQLRRNVSNI